MMPLITPAESLLVVLSILDLALNLKYIESNV